MFLPLIVYIAVSQATYIDPHAETVCDTDVICWEETDLDGPDYKCTAFRYPNGVVSTICVPSGRK